MLSYFHGNRYTPPEELSKMTQMADILIVATGEFGREEEREKEEEGEQEKEEKREFLCLCCYSS